MGSIPRRWLFFICVVLVFSATAVGYFLRTPSPPHTVPVAGTVRLDDVPLDGAFVAFFPARGDGHFATGQTDMNGVFTLKLVVGGTVGAIPGSYVVTVMKIEYPPVVSVESAGAGKRIIGVDDSEDDTVYLTPKLYAHPRTSPLTAEITSDGPNVFAFDLTTP